ncbi:hypothetical protein CIG75_11155 [Tumebacillus algifaecis]|uniref:Uncharacterized protein n=1 Tax=Tumebacillus algifaecis TaxID=1214604 RepID=A0A223D1L4_9BACL|nr:hypothetical protein [Tumebacillus algifaecis]ASS75480.1 hypothetical protein CIG75_11155 [Tumebacillus algifaecis]
MENLTRQLEHLSFDYQPTLSEVIHDESISRLHSVLEGRTGFDLPFGTARLVLHMFPESAFVDPKEYDICPLAPLAVQEYMTESETYSETSFVKIPNTRSIISYTQFFQDGYIEAVDSSDLTEAQLIEKIVLYMEALFKFGVDLPIQIRLYQIDANNRAYQLPPVVTHGNVDLAAKLGKVLSSQEKEPLE